MPPFKESVHFLNTPKNCKIRSTSPKSKSNIHPGKKLSPKRIFHLPTIDSQGSMFPSFLLKPTGVVINFQHLAASSSSSCWCLWKKVSPAPNMPSFWLITLPKTNSSPLTIGRAPQKGNGHIPTIPFQVRNVRFKDK